MHLVTRAFNSVVEKNPLLFEETQIKWYEQILRLIALIHDLGHAPFSHGSELVFPDNLKHEEYTEKITMGTEIAEYINEIGAESAMDEDGIHAFEEFVLARYFMFTQVYFHKTRRFLDKMLVKYLERCLPNGKYPSDINDFLDWDDARVWAKIKEDADKDEVANRLYNRRIMKTVYESPTHTVNKENVFNRNDR